MSTLHSTDVFHYWAQTIRSQTTASLCAVIGLGCIGSVPLVPRDYQIIPAASALLAGLASQQQCETYQANRRVLRTGELIGDDQRNNRFYKLMEDTMLADLANIEEKRDLPSLVSSMYKPKLYEWKNILPRGESFKHIAILGATGDGKTTTLEFLMKLLGGYQLIISPHYKPGDYPGIKVIGKGRNYGSMQDAVSRPLHKLLDPKYDKFSIADATLSLLSEMDARYNIYEREGSENMAFINVAWDEYRTEVANVPTYIHKPTSDERAAGISYPPVKGVGDTVKDLLQEARKVKIRNIICLHDKGVKTGGFEGEGGLRNSFIWVRLGQFALDHAYELLRDSKITDTDYEWLAEQAYPMMVGDMMAEIEPSYFDNRNGEGINRKHVPDSAIMAENIAQDMASPSAPVLGQFDVDGVGAVTKDAPQTTEPIAPTTPDSTEQALIEETYISPKELWGSKVLRQGYWKLLRKYFLDDPDMTVAKLITKVLEVKPGSSYTNQKRFIEELVNEFGALDVPEDGGVDDIPLV